MKRSLFADVVSFALSQRTPAAKALYLFKGLVFYPFLAKKAPSEPKSSAPSHTDDIYPLF